MAIFSLSTTPVSRAKGQSAIAKAAYRAGEKLKDKDGQTKDFTRKSGILKTQIFFPKNTKALSRQELWETAEAAERRKDSRTAREFRGALPAELKAEEREELAKTFACQLVERYGVAADLALHAPSRDGDSRNFHFHLLITTRAILTDGTFSPSKTDLEKSDKDLRAEGKKTGKEQIFELREAWADLCNHALERAGLDKRVSEKKLRAQGLDREATVHMGPRATAMERRGERSERGDLNRQIETRNRHREEKALDKPGPDLTLAARLEAARLQREQDERAGVRSRLGLEDKARSATEGRER